MTVFARWFAIVALFRLLRAQRQERMRVAATRGFARGLRQADERAERTRLAGLAAIARGGAKR